MSEPLNPASDPRTTADILTKAFLFDPFFSWLFPGKSHERNLHQWWYFLTRHASKNPEWALSVDEGNSTSSIWTKPILDLHESENIDGEEQDPFVNLMHELVDDRISQVLEAFAEVNANHPSQPHWYLQAVGTVPEMQGKGRAANLLQPILEICDKEETGAYLESTNPRNLSFYYRLGFEIQKELSLDGGKAALTCMWRDPA
tara:strand:+ start:3996 stop:4601 length:606 start_codon:yes stop_codon:yes gene_type:complete